MEIKSRNTTRNLKMIFYILMVLGVIISAISIKRSGATIWGTVLFCDINDSFMDFFNCLFHTAKANPYIEVDRIYPALPYVFYYLISTLIQPDITAQSGAAIRGSQSGLLVFALYSAITIFIFATMLYNQKKGSKAEKILFISLVFLSTPFIYQLERANIILVALIFLMLFMNLKDSENRILREVAYICLAVSACIKIYPAIFGLLLLKEKKFKEALRCVAYGILLFVVPFIFMGGLDKIPVMIKSLTAGFGYTSSLGYGYKVNVGNTVAFLTDMVGIDITHLELVKNVFSYGFLLISVISALVLKSKWKTVTLLSVLLVAVPSFSYIYGLIFLFIPLIMFMDSEEKRSILDYIYVLFFVGIFILIATRQYGIFERLGGSYLLNMSTFIESIAVLMFLIFLNAEGIFGLFNMGRKLLRREGRRK